MCIETSTSAEIEVVMNLNTVQIESCCVTQSRLQNAVVLAADGAGGEGGKRSCPFGS